MRAPQLTALLLLIGTTVPSGAQPPKPAPAPPATRTADTSPGQQLFVKYGCYQCHGREAQGSVAGPRLGPSPRPYEEFEEYTRAPSGEMPPYSTKILPDADLRAIHAYVSARPKPKPRTER